jgi:hypothetical protein
MKQSMSSDTGQMNKEKMAQAQVDALRAQPPGATRDAMLAAAEKDLYIKQNYRRFSLEVLAWLDRLRSRNTAWNAGTYPAHQWREFSVDIFPTDWSDKALLQLFDDINAASDDTSMDAFGPFAWRGIFNPRKIREAVNAKMGDRYVGEADGHWDHIHLNLKPLMLRKDTVTGFDIENGRVVVP